MRYDYLEAVMDDVRQYLEDNDIDVTYANRRSLESSLFDELFIEDSVTGNASGSYTFNSAEAKENLEGNEDLLVTALREFGCDVGDAILKGSEYCDVTIRCYVLGEAISNVLDEVEHDEEDED